MVVAGGGYVPGIELPGANSPALMGEVGFELSRGIRVRARSHFGTRLVRPTYGRWPYCGQDPLLHVAMALATHYKHKLLPKTF